MNAILHRSREAFPGLEISSTVIPHSERVYCVAFSPDGKTLASGSVNRQVNLWKVGETELADYLKGHTKFVWSLAFSPGGKTLASTSGDGNLFIWDLEKRAFCRIEESHYSIIYPLYDVACSADGKYIAAGCSDSFVRLWSTTSRRPPWKLTGHASEVYSVAFSPDSRLLASGGNDATIRFWDLESKSESGLKVAPGGRISALDFSPDGRFLAAASTNANIHIIDLGSYESRALKGHEGVVWGVAFSPDSQTLISGGNDHTVRLWEVAGGELVHTLEGHLDEVNDVAFSPDGRLAASAANDRTVRVWDLAPLMEQPETHLHLVRRAAEKVIDESLLDFIRGQRRSYRAARTGGGRIETSIAWLKPALRRQNPPPLGLVHDLGRVLTRPPAGPPDSLSPAQPRTHDYDILLAELSRSELRKTVVQLELSNWELGILLDRCLAGLTFTPPIPAPAGQARARTARLLEAALAGITPAPGLAEKQADAPENPFLPPGDLKRLRQRLQALDGPTIRLLLDLAKIESETDVAPELFSLLPAESLPPQLGKLYCEILARTPKAVFHERHGSQVSPAGGYQGLTHKGALDSLALSEHFYPEKLLRHRILNREALYYGREGERPRRRRLNLVLLQSGPETRGAARDLGKALALSLLKQLVTGPGELRFAFCNTPWPTPPGRIEAGTILPRLLAERSDPELETEAFLRQLKTGLDEWRGEFQEIEIVWVVENHFWADLDCRGKLAPVLEKIGRLAGHRGWFFSNHKPSTAPARPPFLRTGLSFYHVDGQLKFQ